VPLFAGSLPEAKALKAFIERRHPEYDENLQHWDFLEATYKGGREWFDAHIFHYIKEGEQEFKDRLARAYRFNHTREVVDLLNKYIFRSPINRNVEDAGEPLRAFWKNATLSGLSIDQYMKVLGNRSSVFGRIWVFVDNNKSQDALTLADEKRSGARLYSYYVKPQDALDMAFTETGTLRWILVREWQRDDDDPIASSGGMEERFRLWTTDTWHLFRKIKTGRDGVRVELLDEQEHGLGRVPCFPLDHMLGERRYVADSMIADIAYLDRAVANYLSNLDAIIQDQSFSQLAMPAQNLLPGEEAYTKLLEMGTKRVFLYDGESNTQPFYLSPDVKQAQIIVQVINKIISEIYHSVGMAGERTKADNAVGIDNSSGVAKAYDFERLNSLLVSKAESLDVAENKLAELVALWSGKAPSDEDLVRYPRDFDVRGLYDEFDIATRLSLIEAPDALRRRQMEDIIDKLFPTLSAELRATMQAELKDWPPSVDDVLGGLSATAGGAARGQLQKQEQPARNAGEQDRQGQVTRNTAA
jgi:hypothetical protein